MSRSTEAAERWRGIVAEQAASPHRAASPLTATLDPDQLTGQSDSTNDQATAGI